MNTRHKRFFRFPLWIITALSTGLASGNVNAAHGFDPAHRPPPYPDAPAPVHSPLFRHPPFGGLVLFPVDAEVAKYLGLTAITLSVLDHATEHQRQLHAESVAKATQADLNEEITWEDDGASGTVKTTRIGHTRSGRECRQFQQTITIDGKKEQLFGTACRQADGSWRAIHSSS